MIKDICEFKKFDKKSRKLIEDFKSFKNYNQLLDEILDKFINFLNSFDSFSLSELEDHYEIIKKLSNKALKIEQSLKLQYDLNDVINSFKLFIR